MILILQAKPEDEYIYPRPIVSMQSLEKKIVEIFFSIYNQNIRRSTKKCSDFIAILNT